MGCSSGHLHDCTEFLTPSSPGEDSEAITTHLTSSKAVVHHQFSDRPQRTDFYTVYIVEVFEIKYVKKTQDTLYVAINKSITTFLKRTKNK